MSESQKAVDALRKQVEHADKYHADGTGMMSQNHLRHVLKRLDAAEKFCEFYGSVAWKYSTYSEDEKCHRLWDEWAELKDADDE